jgi:hypothetical protein
VTDAMRERVRRLAGVGVPQHDIAAIIECDEKTLRKHFSIELNRGVAEANAAAASYLFAKVKEGNVVAQIFWMRSADLIRRFGPRSCEFPSTKVIARRGPPRTSISRCPELHPPIALSRNGCYRHLPCRR